MNPVASSRRPSVAGLAALVTISALLAVSVYSVSQDKRRTANANAGKAEQEIKQLISMYAKAVGEADPTLASRVWCDSSEDSLINPVGRWRGISTNNGFLSP
jgi:type II secretory pathway pseudopilin PulG